MKTALILFCAFAAVAHGRALLDDGAGDGDCKPVSPSYEVLNKTGKTEVREYAAATWAVAFGRSRWSIDLAAVSALKELTRYYAGENSDHDRIPLSIPVVTTVLGPPPRHPPHPPHPPKNGSHGHSPFPGPHPGPHKPHGPPGHKNGSHGPHPPHPRPPPGPPAVAVAGYVSTKGAAPRPDSHHTRLLSTNKTTVYTHGFGGWAISWLVKREIKHLAGDLKDLGVKPCKGKFFVATYDGPTKLFNRRNEVWWVQRPKHHHNKTEEVDAFAGPDVTFVPQGFKDMDPFILFPEEFEAPDDLPEGKQENWSVQSGKELDGTETYVRDSEMDLSDFIASETELPDDVLTA